MRRDLKSGKKLIQIFNKIILSIYRHFTNMPTFFKQVPPFLFVSFVLTTSKNSSLDIDINNIKLNRL